MQFKYDPDNGWEQIDADGARSAYELPKPSGDKLSREDLIPKPGEPEFGLFHEAENVWLGGPEGPTLYNNELFAGLAAQVTDFQLGLPAGSVKAIPYDPGPKHLRDSVDVKCTGEEAIRHLEAGSL